MSIPKKRYEVRKNDMNVLMHPHLRFEYAGLFQSTGEWIHPARVEKTWEIICVTRGEVWISEREREYCVKAGQVLLLAPQTEHRGTRPTRDTSFYWVHFHADVGVPFEPRHFEKFEQISLFKELLHYSNLPQVPAYLVNAVLLHILSLLAFLSEEKNAHFDAQAEKVREWIRVHATAKLTVRAVAAQFGYSADHLSRICKRNYGLGVGALIDHFLLSRAKELLCNTDAYVKEIAAALGFATDKGFIGYFKYHEGCFPVAFRARFAKVHMNNK